MGCTGISLLFMVIGVIIGSLTACLLLATLVNAISMQMTGKKVF